MTTDATAGRLQSCPVRFDTLLADMHEPKSSCLRRNVVAKSDVLCAVSGTDYAP